MGYTPGSTLGGLRVDLGTIPLGGVDSAGIAWGLSKLEGWDSPDIRVTHSLRQSDHGSWVSPVYLHPRVLTPQGTIVAPTGPALELAMDQFQAAVSLGDTTFTVWETVPKQCTVRRSGKLLIERQTDRVATYSALLTAADPRRYSTTLQFQSAGLPQVTGGTALPWTLPLAITSGSQSGTITLTNVGTIATKPTLTITGPATPPTAIVAQYPDGTTRQLTYSDTLNAGDQLVIDCSAHTVMLNGTTSRRRYLSGQWPDIPPGATVSVQWNANSYSSSALLTGTCRSAWM
ncbi:phage distal tail protein [Kitasatospora aureofaciens]|uniref:phage distal tail protein n=1 Tax=Kitasatospora aureofaciens TaxID=1894 RepID=UPI003816072E